MQLPVLDFGLDHSGSWPFYSSPLVCHGQPTSL